MKKKTKKRVKKKAQKKRRLKRSNPQVSKAAITAAERLYEAWNWGAAPNQIVEMKIDVPGKGEILVELGDMRKIEYDSYKSGKKERYVHTFKKSKTRGYPKLLTLPKGKTLHIHGGLFKISPEGIKD